MTKYFLIAIALLCISPALLLADADDSANAWTPGKELFGTLNYRSKYYNVGNTSLNGSAAGHNALTGTAGLRAEFKPISMLQPSFGVGYIFPIDRGGREQLRWGIITSVTFDF